MCFKKHANANCPQTDDAINIALDKMYFPIQREYYAGNKLQKLDHQTCQQNIFVKPQKLNYTGYIHI